MPALPKILIISPINRWGGVNMDVGFIGQALLEQDMELRVLSIGTYFEDSSIFDFIPASNYDSVDRILVHTDSAVRSVVKTLQVLKPMDIPLHHRVRNKVTDSFFNLEKKQLKIIEREIAKCDKLLICSQLTGAWNEQVIPIAQEKNKPILLRITQQIAERDLTSYNLDWLQHVQTFLHHSEKNRIMLQSLLPKASHRIIDQCAMWEEAFLSIPTLVNTCTSFYTIARLEKTKVIDGIISAFATSPLPNGTVGREAKNPERSLHIYGDGSQREALEKQAAGDPRIHFHGAVELKDIPKAHGAHDCLIINSAIEGGPYTAIEAMAAGKLIISTRVGAMMTRLGDDYPYFVGSDEQPPLEQLMDTVSSLPNAQVSTQSEKMRQIYVKNYSTSIIKQQYVDAMQQSL